MIADIFNGAEKTATSITIGWIEKLLISGTLIAVEKHCVIFVLFAVVVFIDLMAKWIALARKDLDNHKAADKSLWACVKDIPTAHRNGLINSYAMKTQFLGKVIVYMIITFPAICIDTAIRISGGHTEFGIMVIAYLCLTELLSIVENLNDAGVSALSGLIAMIKGKRGE